MGTTLNGTLYIMGMRIGCEGNGVRLGTGCNGMKFATFTCRIPVTTRLRLTRRADMPLCLQGCVGLCTRRTRSSWQWRRPCRATYRIAATSTAGSNSLVIR